MDNATQNYNWKHPVGSNAQISFYTMLDKVGPQTIFLHPYYQRNRKALNPYVVGKLVTRQDPERRPQRNADDEAHDKKP